MIDDGPRVFVGWIDDLGQELEDGLLIEGVDEGQRVISIYAVGDEFRASWDDTPTPQSLEKLAMLIESFDDFEAYYVGNMIYPLKQQAKAAVRSLARD